MDEDKPPRQPLIVLPDEGRRYDMGRMQAVFYADNEQTDHRYSISEWWLDPRTKGPGPHAHDEDHVFYVLAGVVTLNVGERTTDAPRGAYAVIPGGCTHDFENRGDTRCGFISLNHPAGFENMMPRLVEWFADNPLEDVDA